MFSGKVIQQTTHNKRRFGILHHMKNRSNTPYVVLRYSLVQFDTIGADMSFVDVKFSKWGGVATAILSQSLVKRFARVMLAAVLAVSFLPVAAFADEGEVEDVPAGNEAVGQPAVPDQPAATESEDPAGSDQPAATESGVPAESDQPAATEPEAPAESEAQPAATELEAFADQPDTEDGSNDKQKSGGDSELKGIKGKKDPIFWYEITSYQNLTKRSSYDWSWEKDGETGAITV
ncbi:MAG: hypothetical protein SOZ63_06385, partial [Eggerthellaceae bacterium]|nr:hypothetical protein [Eggerthellaceae bacterium]